MSPRYGNKFRQNKFVQSVQLSLNFKFFDSGPERGRRTQHPRTLKGHLLSRACSKDLLVESRPKDQKSLQVKKDTRF